MRPGMLHTSQTWCATCESDILELICVYFMSLNTYISCGFRFFAVIIITFAFTSFAHIVYMRPKSLPLIKSLVVSALVVTQSSHDKVLKLRS